MPAQTSLQGFKEKKNAARIELRETSRTRALPLHREGDAVKSSKCPV